MATSVDDETILEVLRSSDEPRLTTTQVATELPVTRSTTRTRLQRLADDDRVERTRETNHVVWWLPERADEFDTAGTSTDEETVDDAAEVEEGAATPGGDNAAEAPPPEDETEGEVDIAAQVDEPDEYSGSDDGSDADERIEVEATERREPDATTVEVDPAGDDHDAALPEEADGAADEPPRAETETRTAATAGEDRDRRAPTPTGRRPDLSDDDEGLRALALLAGTLAALLLLRKLLGGDGDADAE